MVQVVRAVIPGASGAARAAWSEATELAAAAHGADVARTPAEVRTPGERDDDHGGTEDVEAEHPELHDRHDRTGADDVDDVVPDVRVGVRAGEVEVRDRRAEGTAGREHRVEVVDGHRRGVRRGPAEHLLDELAAGHGDVELRVRRAVGVGRVLRGVQTVGGMGTLQCCCGQSDHLLFIPSRADDTFIINIFNYLSSISL